jgi:1-deoxy-D-xylulose-5-phosphate reductoisomerase
MPLIHKNKLALPNNPNLTILGSTGVIGRLTLELIEKYVDNYTIQALVAGTNTNLLIQQALKFKPKYVVISKEGEFLKLKSALQNTEINVLAGRKAVLEVASMPCDWVMSAIIGIDGFEPTIRAAKNGAVIALANKETVVSGGHFFMDIVKKYNSCIIPVDSEHSSLFRLLDGKNPSDFSKLILTASGGPFWKLSRDELNNITPEQACLHPNWKMGKKISIDSATMMNKCLEIVEAYYLFNCPVEKLDIVLHPQSFVHAILQENDGTYRMHGSKPDMKQAILTSLSWNKTYNFPKEELFNKLEFYELCKKRFPLVALTFNILKYNPHLIHIVNIANEIAVNAFLEDKIKFLQIDIAIEKIIEYVNKKKYKESDFFNSVEGIIESVSILKKMSVEIIDKLAQKSIYTVGLK